MNKNWDMLEAWESMGLQKLHPILYTELTELSAMPDEEFPIRFARFVGELERDFALEEEGMEYAAFGGLREHRAAHAELLGLMQHALARIYGGDAKLARKVVDLLPHWFVYHMTTLDLAFANTMSAGRHHPQDEAYRTAA